MGFIILMIAISVISVLLAMKWKYSVLIDLIAVISTFVFVIAIICVPISRFDTTCNVAKFKARASTIQEQRAIASEYERVMLTKEIVDNNAWLIETQICANNGWISIYYDKSVLDLQPIK